MNSVNLPWPYGRRSPTVAFERGAQLPAPAPYAVRRVSASKGEDDGDGLLRMQALGHARPRRRRSTSADGCALAISRRLQPTHLSDDWPARETRLHRTRDWMTSTHDHARRHPRPKKAPSSTAIAA